jgi:probable O-glycosylation ligase (exosortase A-associated)
LRDALLFLIVLAIVGIGLAVPRVGQLGYIWFALLRPDILAWSPTDRPYSKMLAFGVLLGALRFIPELLGALGNPFFRLFLALQAWFLLSFLFAKDIDIAVAPYLMFVQASLVILFMPALFTSINHVRTLVLVMAGSVGVLGVKFGLYGVVAGGAQYAAGYGGSISDNNVAALGLATSIPLCWFIKDTIKSYFWKLVLAGCALLTMAGVVFFHSRGGVLALGAGVLYMAVRSKRKLLASLCLSAGAAVGVYMIRDTLFRRMSTLGSYETDGSSMERLRFWKGAIAMSFDYPIFGVGFGGTNWGRYSGPYLSTGTNNAQLFVHNNYLQVLVDSGYPALLLYCCLLFGSLFWLFRIARKLRSGENKDNPDAQTGVSIAYALQGSLIVFVVGSTFLSRVMYDFAYMLLLCVACLWTAVQPLLQQSAAVPGPAYATPYAAEAAPEEAGTMALSGDGTASSQPEERQSALRRRIQMRKSGVRG